MSTRRYKPQPVKREVGHLCVDPGKEARDRMGYPIATAVVPGCMGYRKIRYGAKGVSVLQ